MVESVIAAGAPRVPVRGETAAPLLIEHMFVYFGHGHVCSCRDAVSFRCPTGCRHRWAGSPVPPCDGPVAGGAGSAGSPGAGRAVPWWWPPEGRHGPARAGIGTRHAPRPSWHARSRPSVGKPAAGIDEPAAPAARGPVVSGALVRSDRPAGTRVSGSGRVGCRSRPPCHHPQPWLRRSLAKRRCDVARDR